MVIEPYYNQQPIITLHIIILICYECQIENKGKLLAT